MEPKKLHAGDSVAWGRAVPEYPASDGWALRYVLHGPQVIEIEAFDDHGVYRVEIEASSTEQWSPGQYRWAAFVVGPNDQRYTIDTELLQSPLKLGGWRRVKPTPRRRQEFSPVLRRGWR